ncbi:hypothetical protein R3P38DRAFT_3565132 [Favolaschia claudopus]|uniref:Uncharacterized protein n=1 Tax=Favolaschia claudopus TaxID=2862362 RepID=A0AAW0DWL6_9AGAR
MCRELSQKKSLAQRMANAGLEPIGGPEDAPKAPSRSITQPLCYSIGEDRVEKRLPVLRRRERMESARVRMYTDWCENRGADTKRQQVHGRRYARMSNRTSSTHEELILKIRRSRGETREAVVYWEENGPTGTRDRRGADPMKAGTLPGLVAVTGRRNRPWSRPIIGAFGGGGGQEGGARLKAVGGASKELKSAYSRRSEADGQLQDHGRRNPRLPRPPSSHSVTKHGCSGFNLLSACERMPSDGVGTNLRVYGASEMTLRPLFRPVKESEERIARRMTLQNRASTSSAKSRTDAETPERRTTYALRVEAEYDAKPFPRPTSTRDRRNGDGMVGTPSSGTRSGVDRDYPWPVSRGDVSYALVQAWNAGAEVMEGAPSMGWVFTRNRRAKRMTSGGASNDLYRYPRDLAVNPYGFLDQLAFECGIQKTWGGGGGGGLRNGEEYGSAKIVLAVPAAQNGRAPERLVLLADALWNTGAASKDDHDGHGSRKAKGIGKGGTCNGARYEGSPPGLTLDGVRQVADCRGVNGIEPLKGKRGNVERAAVGQQT